MQKINLWVHKEDKPKSMAFLQSKGVLHITDVSDEHEALTPMEIGEEGHELEVDVAQLDFAVNFLAQYFACFLKYSILFMNISQLYNYYQIHVIFYNLLKIL